MAFLPSISVLYGNVNGYEGRPTESQTSRVGVLEKDLEAAKAKLDATADTQLATLNPQLKGRTLEPLTTLTSEEWTKRQKI